ncbi:hypothetical protein WJX73_003630 [Symbiochloris irregularis]|uniref:Methylmalonic aciduria and homocystinuria type D protein n=1 Tax=Symbiochloris irregularis TaxID=706552 RepID=A0AAW1NYQ5_9CHLO
MSVGFEFSIHECPARLNSEVAAVYPSTPTDDMLIVPTFQRSTLDLVRMGEAIEAEKDRLLERFVKFAVDVCEQLAQQGYWADYIDPCSGLPMVHRSNTVYSEVEAASTLLKFQTANAGGCKVLLHPRWKTFVYPATMMAKCPRPALQEAIENAVALFNA